MHLFGAGVFIFPPRPLSESGPGTIPVWGGPAEFRPSPPGAGGVARTAAVTGQRGATWPAFRPGRGRVPARGPGPTRGHTRRLCRGARFRRGAGLALRPDHETTGQDPGDRGKADMRLRVDGPQQRPQVRGTPRAPRSEWPLSAISGHPRRPHRRPGERTSERVRPRAFPWPATRHAPGESGPHPAQVAAEEHGQPALVAQRTRRNRRGHGHFRQASPLARLPPRGPQRSAQVRQVGPQVRGRGRRAGRPSPPRGRVNERSNPQPPPRWSGAGGSRHPRSPPR